MAGLASRVQEYLGVIVRVYREKGFKNPVEDFRMREVVMGMGLVRAQGEEADWSRDPFPLEALRKYHDILPEKVDLVEIWL